MRLLHVPSIAAFVGMALAPAAGSAAAWGPPSHQAVGAIADELIVGTPAAKKARQILGSNLQTAAGWADCARSVESSQGHWVYAKPGVYADCRVYENPASEKVLIDFVKRNASRCGGFANSAQCRHKAYHFVDLPIQHAHYDPALPGTAPNDLVHAITATLAVLQGGSSPAPFDIRGKREALRLLTHYLGDLHQPPHVGAVYLDDAGQPLDPSTPQDARAHGNAGGNQIQLEGHKLHQLWDDISDKQYRLLLGGGGTAESRALAPTPGAMAQWPAAWAGESTVEAAKAFKVLKIGARLATPDGAEWPANAVEPDYRHARESAQYAQLVKAGARLAQVLVALWP
jgi:hypothetical protein